MTSARMQMSGKEFTCTAKPHAWAHGIGVAIEIFSAEKIVGVAVVLCSYNSADFSTLSALPPLALCELTLSRFIAEELPVNLEKVLKMQETLRAIDQDSVSPLFCGFSPTGSFPEGWVRSADSGA
jgi:hypothetical protein